MYTQQVEAALTSCNLRPDARAQDLSVPHFVSVHWALEKLQAAEGAAPEASGVPATDDGGPAAVAPSEPAAAA